MKEALIYEKLENNRVRCGVCQRRCIISENQTGFCLTKINKEGQLFTLSYGLLQGIQLDPIEKKPFYHFHPGTLVPSLGSFGCNFHCKQCLNWWCSWGEPATTVLKKIAQEGPSEIIEPKQLVDKIKKDGHPGIAFTYNEPVTWAEYVLDIAQLAKKEELFTLFVTNGSWTKETLDKIGGFINAANVDFKGFSKKTYLQMGALFGEIPEMTKYAQEKHNIFIEITTLLIPGINDEESGLKKMTEWIVKNLGPKTPWHLSRFDPKLAPDKKFSKIPPTPLNLLKKAASIGKKAGLQFVYIWAPGDDVAGGIYSEGNTFCPRCGTLAIQRDFWKPEFLSVNRNGCCLKCGEDLNIHR